MGYYIEVPSSKNKTEQLIKLHDAKEVKCPELFSDVPNDKALICVIDNGLFEAAGYCYSPNEFREFKFDRSSQPRKWIIMDKDLAEKLSGYKR